MVVVLECGISHGSKGHEQIFGVDRVRRFIDDASSHINNTWKVMEKETNRFAIAVAHFDEKGLMRSDQENIICMQIIMVKYGSHVIQ